METLDSILDFFFVDMYGVLMLCIIMTILFFVIVWLVLETICFLTPKSKVKRRKRVARPPFPPVREESLVKSRESFNRTNDMLKAYRKEKGLKK